MLITRNVKFAIDLKRALEALGEYSVTTVAEVRNAIEQLRANPQHLVLLDTANLTISPAIMIEMIRARQNDVALVLAPDRPEVRELVTAYDLYGPVDIPVMARVLLPVLESALEDLNDPLSQTDEASTAIANEDTIAIEALVEDFLGEHTTLNYTRRRLQASYELLHPRTETTLAREAVEVLVEPDDDSDTVRYRYIRVDDPQASTTLRLRSTELGDTPVAANGESETVRDLAQSLVEAHADETDRSLPSPQSQTENTNDLADAGVFEQMLNKVLDESTVLDDLTLESLFDTTRELPGALGTGVVPAWLRETEHFIREPDFLPEFLPPLADSAGFGETTAPSSEPAPSESDETDKSQSSSSEESREAHAPAGLSAGEQALSPLSSREDDPYLAQLALTMTQMMSDVTVDATVLARDNRIVAFSGAMALDDFRELRALVGDDWSAQRNQARIRFLRVPQSNTDYMLQSLTTVANYTLTMIFAGGRQLSEIRQLGERMQSALAAVPDEDAVSTSPENGSSSPYEEDLRQPFAFVWMLSDPALLLQKWVAQQLVFWLEVQLNSLGWSIHRLDVHQDFIYLRADVPGRASPDMLVRTVMERAEKIAISEDQRLPRELWADAYLVLQPGREVSERELERFLQFVRI